jgi:hypothetical protein
LPTFFSNLPPCTPTTFQNRHKKAEFLVGTEGRGRIIVKGVLAFFLLQAFNTAATAQTLKAIERWDK